jgi:hypothetical protein
LSTRTVTSVAIVVTPDISIDLDSLVRERHVWIVDTPSNRRKVEVIWSHADADQSYGVTTFKVDADAQPDEWAAEILPMIDDHHGLRAEWASDVRLDVHGAVLTPRLRAALAELGPFEVTEWIGGFSANRGEAT